MRARLGAALPLLLLSRLALGDGAFPDSSGLLLPPDRPGEILLATNFGLVLTRDGGATWFWVCEAAIDPGLVFLYQQGPPPGDRLYAVATHGVYRSDDACTWTAAGGALAGATPTDAFPSASEASRVLALGIRQLDAGARSGLFASDDGGGTFGEPLREEPDDRQLASVEIPRTAPDVVYATSYAGADLHPYLLRSADRGLHFDVVDELAAVGPAALRIAAVDPDDPRRLYLRAQGAGGDALALSDDGGDTLSVPLRLTTRMTAFLRRADRTVLVGDASGAGHRSAPGDGGRAFGPWTVGVHLRALGERGGRLYAAAASVGEPFTVAVSDDEGGHFQPLLQLADLCGPLPCPAVQAACGPRFPVLAAQLGIHGSAACPRPDGGASGGDGGRDPGSATGCGCALGDRPTSIPAPGAAIAGLLIALAIGRRHPFRKAPRRCSIRP